MQTIREMKSLLMENMTTDTKVISTDSKKNRIQEGNASSLQDISKGTTLSENEVNTVFDTVNPDSEHRHFLQIKVPWQLTYQFCSGDGIDDYVNSVTLSPGHSYFNRESFLTHDYLFNHRTQHFHDFYEVMIVLDGTVTQKIEDHDYRYFAGSSCIINRGLRHTESFSDSARVLFLGFTVPFIKELFDFCRMSPFRSEKDFFETDLCRFLKADMDAPNKKAYLDLLPVFYNQTSSSILHAMTEELLETLMCPQFGSDYIARGLLCRILSYLASPANFHATYVSMTSGSDHLLYSRVIHILEERGGQVTRQDLESVLNYSGDYLNRIVKKYSGKSLVECSMAVRIKKAAELLTSTDLPVSEVAVSCGFSNKTHFYKNFKNAYGITPSLYRENLRVKRTDLQVASQ